MISIAISIPAYNEANNIEVLVENIFQVTSEINNFNFSIFIVDDGSTDNTALIIKKLIQKHTNISVYTHDVNKGFGITIKEVFQKPKTDWVLFLSGDNQFPASNISKMLFEMKNYDFILGYRNIRNDNFIRKFNSYIYNFLVSKVAGRKIKDVSSIALVKSSLVKQLELNSNSGFIHAEILLKSLQKGANLIEVPVLHNERSYGEASGGKLATIMTTFYELLKFWFRKRV